MQNIYFFLLSGAKSLIVFAVLALACLAGFSSRLFAVIRFTNWYYPRFLMFVTAVKSMQCYVVHDDVQKDFSAWMLSTGLRALSTNLTHGSTTARQLIWWELHSLSLKRKKFWIGWLLRWSTASMTSLIGLTVELGIPLAGCDLHLKYFYLNYQKICWTFVAVLAPWNLTASSW